MQKKLRAAAFVADPGPIGLGLAARVVAFEPDFA